MKGGGIIIHQSIGRIFVVGWGLKQFVVESWNQCPGLIVLNLCLLVLALSLPALLGRFGKKWDARLEKEYADMWDSMYEQDSTKDKRLFWTLAEHEMKSLSRRSAMRRRSKRRRI